LGRLNPATAENYKNIEKFTFDLVNGFKRPEKEVAKDDKGKFIEEFGTLAGLKKR
jgi:hypothetical protein